MDRAWTRNPGEGIPAPSPVPFLALWPRLTLGGLWLGDGGLLPSFPEQNLLPRNALRQVCFHLGTEPLVFQWPPALLDPQTQGPCVFCMLNRCTFHIIACVWLGCPVLSMAVEKWCVFFHQNCPFSYLSPCLKSSLDMFKCVSFHIHICIYYWFHVSYTFFNACVL